MNTLGEALLVNAVLAGLLAVVVGIVTRWVKRPEIAYWLWLIVLAKLVTPPLLSLPIPAGHAKQTVFAVLQPTVMLPPSEKTSQTGPTVLDSKSQEIGLQANHIAPSSRPFSTGLGPAVDVPRTPSRAEPPMPLPAPVVTRQPPSPLDRISWIHVLLCVALSGSLCWFSLATVRLIRFSRMIGHSEEIPADLQTIARQMSDRMGIRRCPELRVLAAHIPPLLWWSNWRPIIVLPSDLLNQMESNKQAAMIAHELAHYHRGDHLVRWLAMMILGFYWWHPGVWWAQRRLQQIEEECCDAWVVWALPGQSRNYADLLLDTVEFLATPSELPFAVHGLGQVGQLTRRVE
jgi:beta-lactamase regulating signal transducer with metallopeptidase domain